MILGLAVVWSSAGALVGIAAILALLLRTPLTTLLVDLRRGHRLPRTRRAAIAVAVEAPTLAATAIAAARSTASTRWWIPLAVATPLVVVELAFGVRSRSRRLLPELAGAVAIGSVATAIAIAGDGTSNVAWGLWCVLGARAVAAIPYVRTQVLRLHGRPPHVRQAVAGQAAAVLGVGAGWALDAVPLLGGAAIAAISAANLVGLRRTPRPPRTMGFHQMVLGLAVVAITAVAAHQ